MRHEVWIHPSAMAGYDPAIDHLGWVQPFGTDGKPIDELNPAPDSPPVAGWRTACECGWRGAQFYPRAEFPCLDDKQPHGDPPPAVQGNRVSGAEGEWHDHLEKAVPEVRVYDALAAGYRPGHRVARTAVALARQAGVSWSRIAAVIGISPAAASSTWGPGSRPDGRAAPPPARGDARGHDPRGRGPER